MDEKIISLSTFKNVVFHASILLPVLFLLPFGYLFISSYFLYTLFIIILPFSLFYLECFDGYVIINVYINKIEFIYPYRIVLRKKFVFSFNEIKKIDLSPPPAPRSNPSIEVFLLNKNKSKHIFHLLGDKQKKELAQALEAYGNFPVFK